MLAFLFMKQMVYTYVVKLDRNPVCWSLNGVSDRHSGVILTHSRTTDLF